MPVLLNLFHILLYIMAARALVLIALFSSWTSYLQVYCCLKKKKTQQTCCYNRHLNKTSPGNLAGLWLFKGNYMAVTALGQVLQTLHMERAALWPPWSTLWVALQFFWFLFTACFFSSPPLCCLCQSIIRWVCWSLLPSAPPWAVWLLKTWTKVLMQRWNTALWMEMDWMSLILTLILITKLASSLWER